MRPVSAPADQPDPTYLDQPWAEAVAPPLTVAERMAEARRQAEGWRRLTDPVPEASPRLGRSTALTIGMATFDDFDGAWFTLAAIAQYHPEVLADTSFVIVDNNPTGAYAEALKAMCDAFPRARYVPFRDYQGTSSRDIVFREAEGEVVCCLDSHVLIAPGGLAALLAYFAERPGSRDLVTGPLIDFGTGAVTATHLDLAWRGKMLGTWGDNQLADDPAGPPYELEAMGLGLFACRRDAWPGFHPQFRGFGAEEGYLHERVRRRGGRTVGLPALRWTHRFARPAGQPYRNAALDRTRNYELAFAELGWDFAEGRQHLLAEGLWPWIAREVAEAPRHPLAWVDGVVAINLATQPQRWANTVRRTRAVGLDWRLERVPGVPTPDNHHVGCALAWRSAVARAKYRGWRSVLILEDDVAFSARTLEALPPAMAELAGRDWDLCYLGVPEDRGTRAVVPDAPHLLRLRGARSAHAIIVHERAYDAILDAVPGDEAAMRAWVVEHAAIDAWLDAETAADRLTAFLVEPYVALQDVLLPFHTHNPDFAAD